MKQQAQNENKKFRQNLRATLTPAEAKLWQYIKNKQIGGYKWRRQHQIGKYILDFYCPTAKLAIELDGKHHFTIDGTNADEIRTEYLQTIGITVIRFENKELWENPECVINTIIEALNKNK
jgi:very-short-patch-repair endonuclease